MRRRQIFYDPFHGKLQPFRKIKTVYEDKMYGLAMSCDAKGIIRMIRANGWSFFKINA